jgi:hypothetical protein
MAFNKEEYRKNLTEITKETYKHVEENGHDGIASFIEKYEELILTLPIGEENTEIEVLKNSTTIEMHEILIMKLLKEVSDLKAEIEKMKK